MILNVGVAFVSFFICSDIHKIEPAGRARQEGAGVYRHDAHNI
jgi:hypothetical protein